MQPITRRVASVDAARHRRLVALLAALVLALAACGGDNGDAASPAAADTSEPEPATAPSDLDEEQVCALLDEDTVASLVGSDVSDVRPGHTAASCEWWYRIEGGPTTNLYVQVMTMSQTSNRFGAEALDWALDRAPGDVEITPIAGVDAPNGSYRFSSGVFTLALDGSGRVVTVSMSDETPETTHAEVVNSVLDALAANHA